MLEVLVVDALVDAVECIASEGVEETWTVFALEPHPASATTIAAAATVACAALRRSPSLIAAEDRSSPSRSRLLTTLCNFSYAVVAPPLVRFSYAVVAPPLVRFSYAVVAPPLVRFSYAVVAPPLARLAVGVLQLLT